VRFLPRDLADEPKPQANAELYGTDYWRSRLVRLIGIFPVAKKNLPLISPFLSKGGICPTKEGPGEILDKCGGQGAPCPTMIVVRLPQVASIFAGQAFEETFAFQLVDNAFVEVFADVHVDFHGGIALRDDFQRVA
jgi:hypothetical protein